MSRRRPERPRRNFFFDSKENIANLPGEGFPRETSMDDAATLCRATPAHAANDDHPDGNVLRGLAFALPPSLLMYAVIIEAGRYLWHAVL
jgi:hypothetical protein